MPYIDTFNEFLKKRFNVKVIISTHPIPQKYLDMHAHLGTWDDPTWKVRIAPTMADADTRERYN